MVDIGDLSQQGPEGYSQRNLDSMERRSVESPNERIDSSGK